MANAIVSSKCSKEFFKYELPVLAPTFSSTDMLSNNPQSKLTITAIGLTVARSIATSHFGEFGPDREQRNTLATEEDFLRALQDSQNT
jgi:hypothetical protein